MEKQSESSSKNKARERIMIIDPGRVKPYEVGGIYVSKMLLDDQMAGEKTVQVNQGTIAPGKTLTPSAHEAAEIYIILEGEAELSIANQLHIVKPGFVVFIPAGVDHGLRNLSDTERFVLVTLWRDGEYNDLNKKRVADWGKAFVLLDDQESA